MHKKTILVLIGCAIVTIALLVGGVLYLRRQNAPEASFQLLVPSPSASRAPAPSKDARPDLTPQEKKQADELTDLIQRTPKDIRSTWTPEFRAQQQSLTR